MQTLGIDLAARPKNTAACLIAWTSGRASVLDLEANVDDARLVALAERADKVGLDVPFGWPDAFVEAIQRHALLEPWTAEDDRRLRFRRTDLFVHDQTGKWPLSVSTDRIGVTAFRAARLLSDRKADRGGNGKFVEVYPRAARDRFELDRSVEGLLGRAPWLELEEPKATLCSESEHCFDAVLASLVARAAAVGICEPIPEGDVDAAHREGWIALPLAGSLSRLV